jgi:DNA replication initiation complex subunit (GINS family)
MYHPILNKRFREKLMSEEQPIFKVTDRRLFNPDGTPREIEREETAKPEAAAAETKQAAPASAATTSQAGDASREDTSPAQESAPAQTTSPGKGAGSSIEAATAAEGSTDSGASGQFAEDDYAESQIPGVDDPASFINFLMSIASNAAAALGMMEHPVTGERRVDPELAKHWIDVLGMLHQKTQGNLNPQEQQIFEGLLADLRLQYVSLSSVRQPKNPRGFTGSDITGGR